MHPRPTRRAGAAPLPPARPPTRSSPLPCRYQDRGYVFGYISHFDGMDTGKIIAHVTEGKVNRVAVVYMDDEGNPKKGGGETDPEVVLRELPFKVRRRRTAPCRRGSLSSPWFREK